MGSFVQVQRDEVVATVTLHRPEKLNALDAQVLRELRVTFEELVGAESPVRCAILTGSGKAFVAGADIAAMSEMTPVEARRFSESGHTVCALMESAPFPVIAAVNGYALGGGLELAMACDFIYVSDRAKLGLPEVSLGVMPGFGGTQRLVRRVGVGRARELIYLGATLDAEEALRIGLCNRVVPHDGLLAAARETAEKIGRQGPLAVASAKRVIARGADAELYTGCDLEMEAFASLFGSEDQRAGMKAFLAKEPPSFVGR